MEVFRTDKNHDGSILYVFIRHEQVERRSIESIWKECGFSVGSLGGDGWDTPDNMRVDERTPARTICSVRNWESDRFLTFLTKLQYLENDYVKNLQRVQMFDDLILKLKPFMGKPGKQSNDSRWIKSE